MALTPLQSSSIPEFVALFKSWPGGRRAITLGGSVGKGLSDEHSDLDFRIFHEDDLPWPDRAPELWKPFWPLMEKWRARGVHVDGVWPRRVDEVDRALQRWIDGHLDVEPKTWSIWGYHLPTDIANQHVLEDESGIIARWRSWLDPYPPKLRQAILAKHGDSLRYWLNDYHYTSKVRRGDVVFLAGLSARLVHDIFQVLFSLNERHFPGDGANLAYAETFAVKPPELATRVQACLLPGTGADAPACYSAQQKALRLLIEDTLSLMPTGKTSS